MPAVALDADVERLTELKQFVRREAQDRPGVYRMVTETGEVCYVGKAKKLRTRLLSYFRGEYPRDKSARIVREAAQIEWTYVPSEFAALLRELHDIKQLRPRLNVAQKRDGHNYGFVRLTGGVAPRLAVARGTSSGDRGVYYGPFVGTGHLREALRELSRALGMRDCTLDGKMSFADQMDLLPVPARTPGCLRYEIGNCLGPCIGAPAALEYSSRVREARAFLEGRTSGPIDRMAEAMQEASERLEYERAAVFRDKRQRLEELQARFARLRFAVETLSFVYLVPGHEGEDWVYVVRRGVIRDAFATPKATEDWENALGRVQRVFQDRSDAASAVPAHDVDQLLLVTSWFGTRPEELDATVPPRAFAGLNA